MDRVRGDPGQPDPFDNPTSQEKREADGLLINPARKRTRVQITGKALIGKESNLGAATIMCPTISILSKRKKRRRQPTDNILALAWGELSQPFLLLLFLFFKKINLWYFTIIYIFIGNRKRKIKKIHTNCRQTKV